MSKAKIVLASIIWLCILAIGVLLYRLWWKPSEETKAKAHEDAVVGATSNTTNYKQHIKLGLDGFSGYAVLRSTELSTRLKASEIKLEPVDDAADYTARLNALADGRLQMAAFPIDALLIACANKKSMPAVIVSLIDESRGADALVAYKERYPTIDSLNSPDTRFVLVGGSPSETLFRVLLNHFRLDQVTPKSIVSVSSADELQKRFKAAKPTGNEVFVTWEPFVSRMLADPAMHVLVDTKPHSGKIVDALVVNRDFLLKNEPTVRQVLEEYFRALYGFRERSAMKELVARDSEAGGLVLSGEQADKLVDGIQWKNTQENYAHFGMRPDSVSNVESLIDRIKRVLLDTHAMAQDPTGGESGKLFYDAPLREMFNAGFHPGSEKESVRTNETLRELSEEEWKKLVPVGTLSLPPLVFARGRDTLTDASKQSLDELVEKLESWPLYYVRVVGSAGSKGDVEANRRLAAQRAEAAAEYLRSRNIPAGRIRAVGATAAGDKGGDMSVSFIFVQMPY
ncbi:MAG: OmpA family protein [Pirellulales bacterium]